MRKISGFHIDFSVENVIFRLVLSSDSTSFITERSWKKGSHFLESAAKQKLFQEKKFYQKAL